MDKSHEERLRLGLGQLGLELPPQARERLLAYAALLLKWNQKVNLTAVSAPDEVVEKHLVDSLAIVPELRGATSLLDLGAGAGLPGLPLAVALPGLQLTLVEAVGKKVAFLKSAIVALGLVGRARAVQVHAAGQPATEGVPQAEVVVARAFMELEAFLPLAQAYLVAQGRVVAMLGRGATEPSLAAAGAAAGLRLVSCRAWALPFSGDPRAVAVFER